MAGARSPFDDDDDDDSTELNERDARRVKENAGPADRSKRAGTEDDDVEEVVVGAPEDPEEPSRPGRSERRSNRYREAQDRARAAEEANNNLRLELERERVQRTTIETNWKLDHERRAREASKEPSKLDKENADLWDEHNRLVQSYADAEKAGTLTAESAAKFRERARQIADRRMEIIVEKREEARQRNAPRAEPQVTEQTVRRELLRNRVESMYSEFATDERAQRVLVHKHGELIAMGAPDDAQTLEKAIHATAKQFGFRGARPSQAVRRKTMGVSMGGSGGMTSVDQGGRPRVSVTKAEARMAVASYPKLPRQQAIQRWVNETSKQRAAEEDTGTDD